MDESAQLRIHVLGNVTAVRAATELDLGGRRQRAVLVLLLLARGGIVPAEQLAGRLWGERTPANAPGALQSYVSHLRRRLEPQAAARSRSGVIVSQGAGYAVRLPPEAVDAWRFEALLEQAASAGSPTAAASLLAEALGLWRGPALAEYADETWAEPEVARLGELRAVARERLLAARLACGQDSLLVPELEALVAEEPLREERWRLLALALYRAQRQADALGALRRARETLAEELGVDPGPALRALESRILAQCPTLDVPLPPGVPGTTSTGAEPLDGKPPDGKPPDGRPPDGRPPDGRPPPPQRPGADTDLVERERELRAVRAALADLAAGSARLLLIEGPAGIGKSRLLAEARREAGEAGHVVLTARGSQLERSFGFGAVRQLFEPALVGAGRAERLLQGAAASARGVFDLVDSDKVDGSFAALHGLYRLTVNLAAESSLVLTLDDLQWCDTASLRFLGYLLRRLDGLPVLVVATVRTGERHHDEELLAELALDPSTSVVRPAPLTAEGTAELVRQRLGEPAPLFVRACHGTTWGNPLLLRQLLHALESDRVRPDAAHADVVLAIGSRAVSSLVLARLRSLPPEATEVARTVAVLGEGARLPVVAALARIPEEPVAALLAALIRADILRDEQPLGFVHPLVRDAVYRELPAAERALRHERAGRVLREHGASDEQVAAHLLLAPCRGDRATVAVLRAAAATMVDRGVCDSAVTYLRRAMEEPAVGGDRVDVLLELGLVESLVDGPACVEHLAAAYAELTDPCTRGEVAIAIASAHVFASPPGVAPVFARDAAGALPDHPDCDHPDRDLRDVRQGLLALQRASGTIQGVDPAVWRAGPEPRVTGTGTGARMLAAALAWEAACAALDRPRAVDLARFALEGDQLWQVDNGLLWILATNARMLADDDLGDFWERARADAYARGSLFAAMATNLWQGYWHWRRGELVEALACVRSAEEQDGMWRGAGTAALYVAAFHIDIALDRGDLARARGRAEEVLARPAFGEGGLLARHAVARLRVAEGRYEDALGVLDAVRDPVGIRHPGWNRDRSIRVPALAGLGRTAEAVALAQDHVAVLRRWGAPTHLGPGLRLLGELSGGPGLERLREAVDVLAPTPAVLETARARCSLGRSPDIPDDEAVPLLQAAAQVAGRCGAEGLREEAWTALRRRGQAVDVTARDVAGLSATEQRIVELVARGLDVHEVAQRLFLTPATVRAAVDAAERRGGTRSTAS